MLLVVKIIVYVFVLFLIAAVAIPGFVFGFGPAVIFWLLVGFFGIGVSLKRQGLLSPPS